MLQLTLDNFKTEAEEAPLPVFIEFSRAPGPAEGLGEQYRDRYKFCRVDPEAQRELAGRFHLLKLPASVILSRGQIVQRINGVPEDLEKLLSP